MINKNNSNYNDKNGFIVKNKNKALKKKASHNFSNQNQFDTHVNGSPLSKKY